MTYQENSASRVSDDTLPAGLLETSKCVLETSKCAPLPPLLLPLLLLLLCSASVYR